MIDSNAQLGHQNQELGHTNLQHIKAPPSLAIGAEHVFLK